MLNIRFLCSHTKGYGTITYTYVYRLILKLISPCIKSDFRTLEKLEKKFILNKLPLEFNEIYICMCDIFT